MLVNLDLAYTYPKKGAMVLLFNQGKILSVSRKGDPSKKGLVGGKVDEGETFLQAAVREAKEETGLDVFGLIPVFSRIDGEFFCVVYIGQWKGEIHKTSEKETGVVEWVDWEQLKAGPFGSYNAALEQHLINNNLI
jgi:8-oxo-dGTP pyrophosphatase MutT (NUDIX family)